MENKLQDDRLKPNHINNPIRTMVHIGKKQRLSDWIIEFYAAYQKDILNTKTQIAKK